MNSFFKKVGKTGVVFVTLGYIDLVYSNEIASKSLLFILHLPKHLNNAFHLWHLLKNINLIQVWVSWLIFTSLQLFLPNYNLRKDSHAPYFSESSSKLACQVPKWLTLFSATVAARVLEVCLPWHLDKRAEQLTSTTENCRDKISHRPSSFHKLCLSPDQPSGFFFHC